MGSPRAPGEGQALVQRRPALADPQTSVHTSSALHEEQGPGRTGAPAEMSSQGLNWEWGPFLGTPAGKEGKAVRSRAAAETSGGAASSQQATGRPTARAPETHWILPELGHCPRIPAL